MKITYLALFVIIISISGCNIRQSNNIRNADGSVSPIPINRSMDGTGVHARLIQLDTAIDAYAASKSINDSDKKCDIKIDDVKTYISNDKDSTKWNLALTPTGRVEALKTQTDISFRIPNLPAGDAYGSVYLAQIIETNDQNEVVRDTVVPMDNRNHWRSQSWSANSILVAVERMGCRLPARPT